MSLAKQIVKKLLLPCVTRPSYRLLRWSGYYRKDAEPPRPERILVALYGGIGNVVLATPMLDMVHQAFGEAAIHVWCQARPGAEICRAIPFVSKVFVEQEDNVPRDHHMFIANCISPPLRASLFAFASGASIRVGEDRTGSHLGCLFNRYTIPDVTMHEVKRNLEILRPVGIVPTPRQPFVCIPSRHRASAGEIIRDRVRPEETMIGLHPGSGAAQRFKRWHHSRFAELARTLSRKHRATVLLFGGPDEVELLRAVADEAGCGYVIGGSLSILETAALIEQCDAFVSNDSGLMHIAAAVGTPTVGIFGPTRPQKNRPYGPGHVVASAELSCQPCYSAENAIRCNAPVRCLTELSVKRVLAAVAALPKPYRQNGLATPQPAAIESWSTSDSSSQELTV